MKDDTTSVALYLHAATPEVVQQGARGKKRRTLLGQWRPTKRSTDLVWVVGNRL
jgi:hypothetical protein